MKYKLPRQKIDPQLTLFGSKKIREEKIHVPRASSRHLSQIGEISIEIQKRGVPKRLIVRKLVGKLGFGVFLHPGAKPIQRGEAIAPYSGDVYIAQQNHGEGSDYAFALISDLKLSRDEQRRFDPKNPYHPRRLYSIDLDAAKQGNFTRFINHSEKPNVEAHLLRIPRNSEGVAPSPFEIVYIAKKMIHPGEQLLVCYEGEDKSYWGALKIKPYPMTPRTFQLNTSLKLISKPFKK